VVCPKCAAENRESAKFCSECGAALALRCPACGVAHRAGQKFCDECGTALAAASAAPALAIGRPGLDFIDGGVAGGIGVVGGSGGVHVAIGWA
jgi:hypothetical protein